ncbi:MAG: dihydrodipicolinate synthase family protein [Acidobacteriota bacterium]|nr:dihydrodipicolinate synthase family protein [Acidobacteriota bacterium]
MKSYSGVIPILATPFHDDESIDHESLTRMIRFFAGLGVNGVTVLGVLGESNRLIDSERSALIQTAVNAAGNLPVIAGCSHTGTAATAALSRQAKDLGATAVMIAPSRQPVPSDEVVFSHYKQVAEGTGVPIVLQDHPASTEVHMRADLIIRIAREIPGIVCIKAEATPSPSKITAIRTGLGDDSIIPVLTGLGGLYGFFDLERGSEGFNTGFAFPEVLLAMMAAMATDVDRAYAIYRRFLPLMVFEQQPGLAIRKEILRRRGLIASARVRHPGGNIDATTAGQLERLLARSFPGQDLTRPVEIEE